MRLKNGAGHVSREIESEACRQPNSGHYTHPTDLHRDTCPPLHRPGGARTHLPASPRVLVEGKVVADPGVDPVQRHAPRRRAVDGEGDERGVREGRLAGLVLEGPSLSGVQTGRQVDWARRRLPRLRPAAAVSLPRVRVPARLHLSEPVDGRKAVAERCHL